MKKRIIYGVLILVLLTIGFLFVRQDKVTVYLGVADSELSEIPLRVLIDGEDIFSKKISNNRFEYEVIEIQMNSGFHSLSVYSDSLNYLNDYSLFMIHDQHLVIEYYDSCRDSANGCIKVRNQFREFRLE